MTFLSATASPTPMLTVILVMRGTCIGILEAELRQSLRHDVLAIIVAAASSWHFDVDAHASIISPFDLKKRTLRPSASFFTPTRSPFLPDGFQIATLQTRIGMAFSTMPPGMFACGLPRWCFFTHVDALDEQQPVAQHLEHGATPALVAAGEHDDLIAFT